MIPLRRRDDPYLLIVGMTGVKLGDRLLQIGCAHGGRLGAVAAKVGLSGRAVAVVPDEPSAAQARKGASQAGALVEVEVAPISALPLETDAFDLALLDDTGGLLAAQRPEDRAALSKELFRVLRPGGRVLVLGAVPRSGLAALLARGPAGPRTDPAPLLAAEGFNTPRVLAERDGLIFVEAVKPR
jgi:ubiquinone/menaquinone biosynthesis C-methylase UbiE